MIDYNQIRNLTLSAIDNNVMCWRELNANLMVSSQPLLLNDNLDVWFYVNKSQGINGNRLVSAVESYMELVADETEIFHIRFYDRVHLDIIPQLLRDKFNNVIEYVESCSAIEAAVVWFVGPGSSIPPHEDGHPLRSTLINVQAPGFWLDIAGNISYITEGNTISFNNDIIHSTRNDTDQWWVFVQLHVGKEI